MATTKRISRKELKQPDEFLSLSARAIEFVQRHKREGFVVLAGALVLGLLVWAGSAYSRKREANASRLLAEAQSLLRSPSLTGETNVGEQPRPDEDPKAAAHARDLLVDLVQKFSGTNACRLGRILLGQVCFKRGDYDAAIEAYRAFLKEDDRTPQLEAMAWEGLAYSHEAKKEFEEALVYYEKLSQMSLLSVRGWAYMGLARCYERLGKNEKALEAYRDLLIDQPEHPKAAEAKASLARISQSSVVRGATQPDPASRQDSESSG